MIQLFEGHIVSDSLLFSEFIIGSIFLACSTFREKDLRFNKAQDLQVNRIQLLMPKTRLTSAFYCS